MSEESAPGAAREPYGPGRAVVPLRGVPDGLVAVTIPRRVDGELRVPRDRKQRLHPRRVDLVAATPDQGPSRPAADEPWILGAERRAWSSVTNRFGTTAWDTACTLARTGLVEIRCLAAGAALGDPVALLLTDRALAQRAARRVSTARIAEAMKARAVAASASIESIDPGLAGALRRARGSDARLPVLVHAAEDLAAGFVHDGPRAFSQTHFGHTKQRDDAPAILTAAGAAPETLAALGLERSPYVGLGGLVRVDGVDLAAFRGPVLFRAADPLLGRVRALPAASALVVLENLQAAESVCDTRDDVAVVYSAGQPSASTLGVIAALATHVPRVVLVPDADLGGVRIAERILGALPRTPHVDLVDVGEQPHEPREPFAAATVDALDAACSGPAGELARAVLTRGYPVEQEAATRSALAEVLRDRG